MSTEHASEHDLEYGADAARARSTSTPTSTSAIGYQFASWLAVAMLISVGIVYGTFWLFEGQEQRGRRGRRRSTRWPSGRQGAAGAAPADAAVQGHLPAAAGREREADAATAGSTRTAASSRIPIDDAMDVMLQRGLPARAEGGRRGERRHAGQLVRTHRGAA